MSAPRVVGPAGPGGGGRVPVVVLQMFCDWNSPGGTHRHCGQTSWKPSACWEDLLSEGREIMLVLISDQI